MSEEMWTQNVGLYDSDWKGLPAASQSVEEMSVEILARIQFAFTAAFHYIYPPLSIGLGLMLVLMEGKYIRTGDEMYHRMTRFWVQIFAIIFGIGVATGIVMEFEFGTNWATYSRYVGDVFGSALAAEGIFAFFLESGFLAILVFGWNRVSPKVHFFSTIMVALGSTFSAVWIVVANSWMQTPAGFRVEGSGLTAKARITDFWAMVFNPSSIQRLTHSVSGAWITGAMLVVSVSAFYLVRKRNIEMSRASLAMGLKLAFVACILQMISGHYSAVQVAATQPEKMAAMEGHWNTGPLGVTLLGIPSNGQTNGITIPNVGSLLLAFDLNRPVKGLNDFPAENIPPVAATFHFFHLMVGIGVLLLILVSYSLIQMWRGKIENQAWLLKLLVPSVILPELGNQFGWFTAEIGRQPWIVYGLLRTSDGLSKVVKSEMVVTSLVLFMLIYVLLFLLFMYSLDRKIRRGPDADYAPVDPGVPATLGEVNV